MISEDSCLAGGFALYVVIFVVSKEVFERGLAANEKQVRVGRHEPSVTDSESSADWLLVRRAAFALLHSMVSRSFTTRGCAGSPHLSRA
jgi:hypothetical protein